MIDSVFRHLPVARERQPWRRLGVEPGRFALVTLHRPALVDDLDLLGRVVESLVTLAKQVPVLFPVHPRTGARLASTGVDLEKLRELGLRTCPPLGYLDFLGLEAEAAFVLTDSGGVQEETSALGVACFTLRNTTERPVTVELGTNTILGTDPDRIAEIPGLLAEAGRRNSPIPLWDGAAGTRTALVIQAALTGSGEATAS